MDHKNNSKTPMEKPTKKIPHETTPTSDPKGDPDLTPDDDNPINPNETTPPKSNGQL